MKKILVAAAVMACFGTAGAAEDITVDVAVIGAGGAGLSAAVQAHELGANVVVVEKMAMVGGNTVRAAGGLNAVGTALQQAMRRGGGVIRYNKSSLRRLVHRTCSRNYSCGPAETRALPCSLPSYLAKFLMKRPARSRALVSHSEASL